MKMFKSSMVWALVAFLCVAQDASAGRFIVSWKTIKEYDNSRIYSNVEVATKDALTFTDDEKLWFARKTDWLDRVVGEKSEYTWMKAVIIDVPECQTPDDLARLAYSKKWTSKYALTTSWNDVFTQERLNEVNGKIVDFQLKQPARSDVPAPADAPKRADVPVPVDVPEPADDKEKKDTKLNSFQDRFMSYHAGYRYAGANVAILVIASMLQAMQDGYRGVGIEAKDVTALSVKKKALRALAACVSLKRYGANVSALYRVVRPVSEKGVMSPKFLARATQFAKNKPFIAAGLLGVTALNVYGAYSHAGDIKAYAGDVTAKTKKLVFKK